MFKRIVLTVLMSFLVLGALYAQRENARTHITQGQEHLASGNYEGAVASFEAALRLEPRNRQAPPLLRQAQEGRATQIFTQAQALVEQGRLEDAVTQFNLALRTAPAGFNTRNIETARASAQRLLRERGEAEEAQARAEAEERARVEAEARAIAERERSEILGVALDVAHQHFLSGRFHESIVAYERVLGIGGLTPVQTTETNRLIQTARDVQEKATSYTNRPIRDADFEVAQNPTGVTITGYNGVEPPVIVTMGGQQHYMFVGIRNVVIPQRIYNVNVTIIGEDAFRNKGLISVVIPNTVTEIMSGAFADNRLERVTLSTTLRAIRYREAFTTAQDAASTQIRQSRGAFENNPGLIEITIPDTLQTIEAFSFYGCGLTRVQFGRQTNFIGNSAFRNNKISAILFTPAMRRIGFNAFQNNQLSSVVFTQGIEWIKGSAFIGNPLVDVTIPASLASPIPPANNPTPRIGSTRWDQEMPRWDPEVARTSIQDTMNLSPFPATLARVVMPGNVHDINLEAFQPNLRAFYTGQQRRAGVMVLNGPIWSRQ
ncbi:MAG: leucine-rich repeat protein [Treponema sp.]|nr:leucine-rich repeat protein [Treponema sp.]MCL2237248.1 leucine-rich repeat protein [Treponema sp.]